MTFLPLQRMWERIERARADSDTALFHDLMLLGELALKSTVAGLVASIDDDVNRYRYCQVHRLVRADGLGEWASVLDDVLTGPSAQYLRRDEASQIARALTQKVGSPNWQYECALLLDQCLRIGMSKRDTLPPALPGKRFLLDFAELRNKTRGHGATSAKAVQNMLAPLERALTLYIDNFPLFLMPWAFLHQNLSGSYRVSKMTGPSAAYDPLKSKSSKAYPDGVYLILDSPRCVELLHSDTDHTDFFFPNGAFNGKRYELLSYITGTTIYADATRYSDPAQELPPSATQGLSNLDIQGGCFGNVPAPPSDYVRRPNLDKELNRLLLDERHPVITLYGPGGIGKTSLALTALTSLTGESAFNLMVWFSARDIELLPEGPKPVRPHVLTIEDIAAEFARLVSPENKKIKGFRPIDFLHTNLSQCTSYGPTLFVFDNFETVRNLADVYTFIDTYIRLPNKALITTRMREFKGDYPIEVSGMSDDEATQLIIQVSRSLGIENIVTDEYRQELLTEAGGHPYVIKILLGEVAKDRHLSKVKRVVASQEHVLTALFERTYQSLSPVAKRVYLTLCSWRSMVPLVALKAVLFRPANERMDVDAAVEELRRTSLLELVPSEQDEQLFVDLPLSASVFGREKARVDPMKAAIEGDLEFLRAFGPTQETDIRHGIKPRLERLYRCVSEETFRTGKIAREYMPVLEYVANSYPSAWLKIADLYDESDDTDKYERVKEALLNYIQRAGGEGFKTDVWDRLGRISHRAGDWQTEIHANVEMCQDPHLPFWQVSDAANRVNARFREGLVEMEKDERRIIVRKLADIMEKRSEEGTATDFSRLAWLFLRLGDEDKARKHVGKGLAIEEGNEFCQKLAVRLGMAAP